MKLNKNYINNYADNGCFILKVSDHKYLCLIVFNFSKEFCIYDFNDEDYIMNLVHKEVLNMSRFKNKNVLYSYFLKVLSDSDYFNKK